MYFFITFHMFREKQSINIKMSISWLYKNHICRSKCLIVSLQLHSQIKQLETEHPVLRVQQTNIIIKSWFKIWFWNFTLLSFGWKGNFWLDTSWVDVAILNLCGIPHSIHTFIDNLVFSLWNKTKKNSKNVQWCRNKSPFIDN